MDTEKGRKNFMDQSNETYNNLHGCFNLDRLFEGDPDYQHKALVNRLIVKMDKYLQDKDPATGQKVHIFIVK